MNRCSPSELVRLDCPECGRFARSDEDGCCQGCGRDLSAVYRSCRTMFCSGEIINRATWWRILNDVCTEFGECTFAMNEAFASKRSARAIAKIRREPEPEVEAVGGFPDHPEPSTGGPGDRDPYDTPEAQEWLAGVARECQSPHAPCQGCMAGGICDGPGDDPWDDLDAGDSHDELSEIDGPVPEDDEQPNDGQPTSR